MRTLLALVLALLCGTMDAAVFNNDFTTNAFHVPGVSPGAVFVASGIPGSVTTTSTNAFFMKRGANLTFMDASTNVWSNGSGTTNVLPKWLTPTTLGDSRVLDTGFVMAIGVNTNSTLHLGGITNSTDVIGIGDFALDSLVGDGLLNIYAIGPSALANATLAPFSSQIFAYGESALSGALLTNATHIYAYGESSTAFLSGDGPVDVYVFGKDSLGSAALNNGAGEIYAIGQSALNSANLDSFTSIYAFGSGALASAVLTNNSELYFIGANAGDHLKGNLGGAYAFGSSALSSATADSSSGIMAIGDHALASAKITNSGGIFAFGPSALRGAGLNGASDTYAGGGVDALRSAVITNGSQFVVALGPAAGQNATFDGVQNAFALGLSALSGAQLTNASDVYAIGSSAGSGLGASGFSAFQHVFLIGSGAFATTNNQWVAGDAAYLYQFPGVEATFGGFVALSGTTNQYTDDGSTLLRNGVPITAAGPAANGISDCVTLTYTTTNLTASSIDWNATNVCYTLLLTNHILIGDNASINVPVTTKHKYIELNLIQNGTGGWAVKFTNNVYGGVNGTIPLTTNANSWDSLILINSKQTNGNIMVLPSNFLHR